MGHGSSCGKMQEVKDCRDRRRAGILMEEQSDTYMLSPGFIS
jgi:hypothetical protein